MVGYLVDYRHKIYPHLWTYFYLAFVADAKAVHIDFPFFVEHWAGICAIAVAAAADRLP